MVGIDVGFDNPLFACIELDYEEADNDPNTEVAELAKQVICTPDGWFSFRFITC